MESRCLVASDDLRHSETDLRVLLTGQIRGRGRVLQLLVGVVEARQCVLLDADGGMDVGPDDESGQPSVA